MNGWAYILPEVLWPCRRGLSRLWNVNIVLSLALMYTRYVLITLSPSLSSLPPTSLNWIAGSKKGRILHGFVDSYIPKSDPVLGPDAYVLNKCLLKLYKNWSFSLLNLCSYQSHMRMPVFPNHYQHVIIIILYKYCKLNGYQITCHIFNVHFSNSCCSGIFITGLVFICTTSIVNFSFISFVCFLLECSLFLTDFKSSFYKNSNSSFLKN